MPFCRVRKSHVHVYLNAAVESAVQRAAGLRRTYRPRRVRDARQPRMQVTERVDSKLGREFV